MQMHVFFHQSLKSVFLGLLKIEMSGLKLLPNTGGMLAHPPNSHKTFSPFLLDHDCVKKTKACVSQTKWL